jgi:hypothetical protein
MRHILASAIPIVARNLSGVVHPNGNCAMPRWDDDDGETPHVFSVIMMVTTVFSVLFLQSIILEI